MPIWYEKNRSFAVPSPFIVSPWLITNQYLQPKHFAGFKWISNMQNPLIYKRRGRFNSTMAITGYQLCC
jgi:hypothetical protein